MDGFLVVAADSGDDGDDYGKLVGIDSPRAWTIQLVLSLALGVTAFLTFCVLRPRWSGLYAARKKQKGEAMILPELPNSLFGWILPLWRITDQQILASAGLDAFAFLTFFKMAMKFLAVALFFSLAVIKPVHDSHPEDPIPSKNGTKHDNSSHHDTLYRRQLVHFPSNTTDSYLSHFETDYLWMYVVFAYLFSGLAIYLMISSTRRVIEVRQEYLGSQTSLTDRTIRLSWIPPELREESKIKEFIESLDIGKVEHVTLCRNWKELDNAMDERMKILRRLEEAYTTYSGRRRVERNLESLPIVQPSPPSPRPVAIPNESDDGNEDESAALVQPSGDINDAPYERARPKTTIRHGFMKLRSRQVDAIDYHEEKLRQADARIHELRRKAFTPTPLAFVTMDSVAACQMAIQAVLDPSPLQLIASQSPAPADVIWTNTYMTRRHRMIRTWGITALIILLTLFWASIFVGVAGLLTIESLGKIFPGITKLLKHHENLQSVVSAQLPTLITSLMIVLVPYLYYWLSWYQGFMSQGDVELSAISKNFFFTFFNFFIVFTISGTGIKFYEIFQQVGNALRKDVWKITFTLAESLQRLLDFYVNFIMLQGLGLLPLRLLEMGSVSLYPVYRIGAKTPRDYAELVQPPVFNYGFYLPTAMLIFIICMVYSVLRDSWSVLLAGLIYFALGHYVYKYQLLYAMDNQQQATGRAWVMICDRIFVGLVFFQLATIGQLALKKTVTRSALLIPLVIATVWFAIAFSRTYKPLMKFIALRSAKQGEAYADVHSPDASSMTSNDLAPERRAWAEADGRAWAEADGPAPVQSPGVNDADHDDDEIAEVTRTRFINPSLVAPLRPVWIADATIRREVQGEVGAGEESA